MSTPPVAPWEMPDYFFRDALQIDCSSAAAANLDEQKNAGCEIHPRYWYMDAWHRCVQCQETFWFMAEEQRTWYEVHKFDPNSYPNRCRACRAVRRQAKLASQQYGLRRAEAIKRTASAELKKEVLGYLEDLERDGRPLSDRMLETRSVLEKHLRVTGDG
ncbi:MAG: zinc-ribbon domain containing protein [Phycisphaerales bacterium]